MVAIEKVVSKIVVFGYQDGSNKRAFLDIFPQTNLRSEESNSERDGQIAIHKYGHVDRNID